MSLGSAMMKHRNNLALCRLSYAQDEAASTHPRSLAPLMASRRERLLSPKCEQAHCSNPGRPLTKVQRIACDLRGCSIVSKMKQTIERLSGQVAPLVWSTQE